MSDVVIDSRIALCDDEQVCETVGFWAQRVDSTNLEATAIDHDVGQELLNEIPF